MKTGTKAKIIATIVCAFALCAALVGCGGPAGSDNATSPFQGDWVLSGGVADGQELDQQNLDAMEQMGLHVYVQFNEDGSLVLNMFGNEITGTWTAKDATTADITIQGDTEEVKIENDELKIEADGNALMFKKGEIPAAETTTAPDAEESATPEA